jgi:hypothetical protein
MKKIVPLVGFIVITLLLISCTNTSEISSTEPPEISIAVTVSMASGEPDSVGESAVTAQPTTDVPTTSIYLLPHIPMPDQMATNDLERRIAEVIGQDSVIFESYQGKGLPTEGDPIAGSLYGVHPNYFDTFQKLKDYVENTFVKAESDRILYSWRDNKPMYLEYNGVFCKDESIAGYRGSKFGLEGFLYQYVQGSQDVIELTITAWTTDYDDINASVPYEIHTRLLLEDGVWKLEKMLDQ